MHEYLREVAAVRLILGLSQDHLRGADNRSRGVFGAEHDALAARHTRGRAAPECVGLCAGHRQHEADGRAALHTIDQHVAQSFDLALPDRLKTTDPNGVRHVHLLDARDLQSLAVLDRRDVVPSLEQACLRACIKPRHSASHHHHFQLIPLEIFPVHVCDF